MEDLRLMETEEILKIRPRWRYVRTDRNKTRYFEDATCRRCGGRGVIDAYRYVDGGVCFECGGSGIAHKAETIKIYTPEHEAKLEKQRLARAEKAAAQRVAKANAERPQKLVQQGFGLEDGTYVIYRVVGNTFSIRDELKQLGGKYKPCVGWYFSQPLDGYECQRMEESEVLDMDSIYVQWKNKNEVAPLWIERNREPEFVSNWVGEVGERIDLYLHIDRMFEGGVFYGKQTYMYLMHDEAHNIFKWSTSCFYKEGEDVHFKATIKDHTEFQGIKQNVLTRCTLVKE